MSKIPGSERDLRLLVNCKTYPAISTKYIETVCTGGVQESGEFVRLYPVPFRFLDEHERYDRWDVIHVRAYKDTKDSRPESWHWIQGTPIKVIQKLSERQRWDWMKQTVHESTAAMEQNGLTNGCVQIVPLRLYWQKEESELTTAQLNVVRQTNMFISNEDLQQIADRMAWQFRLEFRQANSDIVEDAKVLAWSWYQGLRRRLRKMDDQSALQDTVDFISKSIFNPARTVFAIFGTHSRFGHWMISSLYHVPKEFVQQRDLF